MSEDSGANGRLAAGAGALHPLAGGRLPRVLCAISCTGDDLGTQVHLLHLRRMHRVGAGQSVGLSGHMPAVKHMPPPASHLLRDATGLGLQLTQAVMQPYLPSAVLVPWRPPPSFSLPRHAPVTHQEIPAVLQRLCAVAGRVGGDVIAAKVLQQWEAGAGVGGGNRAKPLLGSWLPVWVGGRVCTGALPMLLLALAKVRRVSEVGAGCAKP